MAMNKEIPIPKTNNKLSFCAENGELFLNIAIAIPAPQTAKPIEIPNR